MRYLKALELSLNPDIKLLWDAQSLERKFANSSSKQELLDTCLFRPEFILKLYLKELNETIDKATDRNFDSSVDLEDVREVDLLRHIAFKIMKAGYNPTVCSITELRQLFLNELGGNLAVRAKALFVAINLFRLTILPLYKKYEISPPIPQDNFVLEAEWDKLNDLYYLAMSMLPE